MAGPANLQMIGMIPMPEAHYQNALKANLDALRRAMTPHGINTTGLKPPPTRMMPVGRGPDGQVYALVETCNPNHRPTAVPLSSMYPSDPKNPNALPAEFRSMDALRHTPGPPADAGLAALKPAATAAVQRNSQAALQVAQSGVAVAQGGSAVEAATSAVKSLAQPLALAAAPAGPQLSPDQAKPLVQAMRELQESRESQTQAMLGKVFQQAGAGRSDPTAGLGATVLGVTATQDPARSQALFQQMAAEKAVGLQPQGGIYQRLQTALAAVPENPLSG
jgi:hypothetical protein